MRNISMYRGLRILALIPARGGSKGLPGKNIRPLHGKPLVAWSIEAALECGCIDTLTVSTDSPEITEVAKSFGAEVPFLRPEELATDTAKTVDVVLHALDWYAARDRTFDVFILLQPTSPLRTAADILRGLELFVIRQARAVISVCRCEHHPFWTNSLPEDGAMANFLPKDILNKPRQSLPPYYRLNGALYIADVQWFYSAQSFFGTRTYALVMDRKNSVDIDEMLDFNLAELLLAGA